MNNSVLDSYRSLVNFNYLPYEKLIAKLYQQLPIVEKNFSEISEIDQTHLDIISKTNRDTEFRFFILSRTNSTDSFYDVFVDADLEQNIYLIIGNDKYLESNSNELFKMVYLLRGIPVSEYTDDSLFANEYIGFLKMWDARP